MRSIKSGKTEQVKEREVWGFILLILDHRQSSLDGVSTLEDEEYLCLRSLAISLEIQCVYAKMYYPVGLSISPHVIYTYYVDSVYSR